MTEATANRWHIERTPKRRNDVVLGNATRPAMLVARNGELVERRAAALADLAALDGESM
jgi:hypothetical protein